jgi:hypothetical protein
MGAVSIRLTLNADGTYIFIRTFNGRTDMQSQGDYRVEDGRLFILTGTEGYLRSSWSINYDLRLTGYNLLLNDRDVLIKDTVIPADYEGEDFLGVYRAFFAYSWPCGCYGATTLTLTLNADGTYTLTEAYTAYEGGYGYEHGSNTYHGYFRVVDGVLVFFGSGWVDEEIFLLYIKCGGTPIDYSHLPVIGIWVAGLEAVEEFGWWALVFGADGIATFIDAEGNTDSYLYYEVDGEYRIIFFDDGVFRVTLTDSGLTVVYTDWRGEIYVIGNFIRLVFGDDGTSTYRSIYTWARDDGGYEEEMITVILYDDGTYTVTVAYREVPEWYIGAILYYIIDGEKTVVWEYSHYS